MNFTITEIALLVVAVSVATFAFHGVRNMNRIGRAASELEGAARRVSEIMPKLDKVLDESAVELQELRALTRRSESVAADVQAISGELRKGVMLLEVSRKTRAALAGAKAGFAALMSAQKQENGKGDEV